MNKNLAEKLWIVAAPILQKVKSSRGRPEHHPKKTFLGALYVLENGLKWRCLPRKYGPTSTVHGKFLRWIKAGIINEIFEAARYVYLLKTDAFPNWLATDTSSCKAPYAKFSGKNPTDRAKQGIKKNILVDSRGAVLGVGAASANQHDSKLFGEILDLAKPIKKAGLLIIAADSAYDSAKLKQEAARRGIVLYAATNKRRNKDCPITRPKGRWIVEAAHSWFNNFRGIKTCYQKTKTVFVGCLQFVAAIHLLQKSLIFG